MFKARLEPGGFALIVVLLLLVILYAGATGGFLAARAELHSGTNQAVAERTFHAVDGALATWLADPVQPATRSYDIGGTVVGVSALPLLAADSMTTLYLVVARSESAESAGTASHTVTYRAISVVGSRTGHGSVVAVPGTWRERF